MNVIRKLLLIMYICVPFLLGIVLFSFGIVNLFSSLCLFLGGYIFVKNTLDYRVVRKNREFVKRDNIKKEDKRDVVGAVRTKGRKRERIRVRKK